MHRPHSRNAASRWHRLHQKSVCKTCARRQQVMQTKLVWERLRAQCLVNLLKADEIRFYCIAARLRLLNECDRIQQMTKKNQISTTLFSSRISNDRNHLLTWRHSGRPPNLVPLQYNEPSRNNKQSHRLFVLRQLNWYQSIGEISAKGVFDRLTAFSLTLVQCSSRSRSAFLCAAAN